MGLFYLELCVNINYIYTSDCILENLEVKMEIRKQIEELSESPIFFMSPNIGIKYSIIKAYPQSINKRYKNIYFLIENNRKYPYKDIDLNYIVYIMLNYLDTHRVQLIKEIDFDSIIEKLPLKESFYTNAFLAYYYYDTNNFERTEPYLKYALKYVENNPVSDYEKMCIYALSADFLSKTQDIFLSGAENYFIQALKFIKGKDSLGEISLLNSLAYYYHNVEKRDKAIEYINIALEMVEKYNFSISSFTTYKNAGIIYTTIGDFVKAKENFIKASAFSKELKDNTEENVKLLNTLGYVEFLKGDFTDSLKTFEKAVVMLNEYTNSTKLLDEAVKSFDNLGNILKFLGDIDSSIKMQIMGKDILERINSMNRVNEVHNLSKIYTDIALTYLLYRGDTVKSKEYYILSEIKTDENEHYIKRNKKIILETLIDLTVRYSKEKEKDFFEAIERLKENGEDNLYVQLILIEFLLYYSKLKNDKEIQKEALDIAQRHNLFKHYGTVINIFFHEEERNRNVIDFEKYPLNLINLLSLEKKELLTEIKKSKHLELIEEFIIGISKSEKEEELFTNAEKILNKHFFSRGFLIVEESNKKCNLLYCNKLNINFIEANKESFCKEIKNSKIVNFEKNSLVKSMMIEKIFYKEENVFYYFILFNDSTNDWNFNIEEEKAFNILINNLYLKHKNILQLKKIELNSITDFMTGFRNASYYNEAIKTLIQNYKKTKEKFGIVIVDLNKFKLVNDTYGHDTGDKILQYFAQTAQSKIKSAFDFIRYGGDEFIILFDNDKIVEEELLEMKKYFKSNPFIVNGDKIIVDFSYGIELYSGQDERDFFKIADNKMYSQKTKVTI